jgi:hypothetical protein
MVEAFVNLTPFTARARNYNDKNVPVGADHADALVRSLIPPGVPSQAANPASYLEARVSPAQRDQAQNLGSMPGVAKCIP